MDGEAGENQKLCNAGSSLSFFYGQQEQCLVLSLEVALSNWRRRDEGIRGTTRNEVQPSRGPQSQHLHP